MKNEMRLYLIWILILANLLYDEYWGINVLIISVVTVGVLWYRNFFAQSDDIGNQFHKTDALWYVGAAIWLISATAVFLIGGPFQIMMFMLSMIYFGSLQDRKPVSVPLSGIQSAQSFATGVARIFMDISTRFKGDQATGSKKMMKQIILFSAGLIICIVFLKLYQLADPDFYELTRFINLDWISWGFIFFYIALTWLMYGFYYYKSEPSITKLDEALKNEIEPSYSDSLQRYFGVKQERTLATVTLLFLNTMLILLLILDVRFLMTDYGMDKPVADYSSTIHQGINALIFSLILVILLITMFFRGSLNFENHKWIKLLGLFWLFLNCILVVTTAFKNFDYIAEFGFTYKRLGVLLYLFLCGLGLIFSFYKVLKIRSVWFLIRNTSLSFVCVFAVVSMFNWNQIIAKYNLENVSTSRLDLEYIFDLGADSYPYLMNYHITNQKTNTDLFYRLAQAVEIKRDDMFWQLENSTWRSYTLRDELLYKKLMSYRFEYENKENVGWVVRD